MQANCAGDESESSNTMVEIKIKTLDSQTYSLRVNKRVSIPALKEEIAIVTGVLSEQQRLICRGKVLKDEDLLSAYHVEDGHTLHLVTRQPVPIDTVGSDGASDHTGDNSPFSSSLGHQIARIVFDAVNFGGNNSTLGFNSETGPINVIRSQPNSNTRRFAFVGRRQADVTPASNQGLPNPEVIPDSLTTLRQYLGRMRDEFRREGFTASGGEDRHAEEVSGSCGNGRQDGDAQSPPVSEHSDLPRPANLAEILLSTRELLIQQAGGGLSHLARHLVDLASMTDPLTRTNVQSNALRFGAFMQNLGFLLLELGRTTMRLRTGQTTADTVVNAGPAVFISTSEPNPMRVQPPPYHLGSILGGIHFGSTNSGRDFEGSREVLPVRQVVTIPSGVNHSSSSSSNSAGILFSALDRDRQLNLRNLNDERGYQASTEPHPADHEGSQRPIGDGSQIPANSAPPDSVSSTPNDSAQYQGVARVFITSRPRAPSYVQAHDGQQSDVQAHDRQQNRPRSAFESWLRSVLMREEVNANSADRQDATTISPGDERGSPSNSTMQETPIGTQDQGIFFSNLVRQIMPHVSQSMDTGPDVPPTDPSSSTAQAERENLTGSSSSQQNHDPPEAPNPKRQKLE